MATLPVTRPRKYWKWISHESQTYRNIARCDDGTLWNPNGYPEKAVLAAIEYAEERRRQGRSEAAKKAAVTRRKRTDKRIYEAARRIVDGHIFGPSDNCFICGKGLATLWGADSDS